MTISQFISNCCPDLSGIISAISKTSVILSAKLAGNGLIDEQGDSGSKNVYGEDVQKLDAFADHEFSRSLLAVPEVHAVGSEELAEPVFSNNENSKFIITYDPLDGSSNIDINLPVGTIFGIYPKNHNLLQKGSTLISSGYVLYGPSMMIVIAVNGKVNGFTFDRSSNEFLLSHPDIKVGNKKIYSVNEGNRNLFSENDRKYLESLKTDGNYSLRYVGSMVGDIHRTLIKGGIFLYPLRLKAS